MKLAILLVLAAAVAACSDDPAPGAAIQSARPMQLVPAG